MDTLTAAEYDTAVETYVSEFLGGYDDEPDPADIPDDVWDDARYHSWFSTDHPLTLYASIIEHADPAREYSDWETACDARRPEKVVKRLALNEFENDAIERALTRLVGGGE